MRLPKLFKFRFHFLNYYKKDQNLNSVRNGLIFIGLIWTIIGIASIENISAIPSNIVWKKEQKIDLASFMIEEESLQKALQRFIDRYPINASKIFVDPTISGNFSTFQLTASSVKTAFQWILTHYELATIYKEEQWWILPKKEVWRQQSYRKLVRSPLSLQQVLDDLAKVGQISIVFDPVQTKQQRIQRNLIYPSVEAAIQDLVRQFKWLAKYNADFHTLHLIDEELVQTQSILLENIEQSQVERFFDEATPLFEDLRRLDIFYPSENILMLKGSQRGIDTIFSAVKQFDQAHSATPETNDYHFESILLKSVSQQQIQSHLQPILEQNKTLTRQLTIKWQEEKETETSEQFSIVSLYGNKLNVQKLSDIINKLDQTYLQPQPLVIDKVALNYLHVNSRKIISSGEEIFSEGAEIKLQKIFQQLVKNEKGDISTSFQIIPDFLGNSLILRGTAEEVKIAKKILEIWDKPQPIIKIEAHIFETSDTVSQELGMQFSGRGIPKGGEAPNVESAGPFTAGAILGPLQTTKAFQVDALLRLMEAEGKGRVLSRPIVVTMNNIEAEMRSGDIINVKVVIDNKPTLKKIKTGVILRVTPRLIKGAAEELTDYKIRLNVFAESSTPINETVDSIPRINSQTARSEVVVRNGEPFLLGGLIRSNSSESNSGIPLLKDLPIFGYLFKVETLNDRFNHILVFVTPSVILPDQKQTLPETLELKKTPLIEEFQQLLESH